MPKFKLTYARVVILEREIEAENLETAKSNAEYQEMKGELNILLGDGGIDIPDESAVRDIEDYDAIWEIEEI